MNHLFSTLLAEHASKMETARGAGKDPRIGCTLNKLDHHALLGRLGLPHAEVYRVIKSDDINADMLKRPCTVKPARGAASVGVMVLDQEGPGWRNARTGRRVDFAAVKATMASVQAQYPWWGNDWIIEERLYPADGSPEGLNEYNVFIFGDAAELIICSRQNAGKRRVRCWTPAWQEAAIGRLNKYDSPEDFKPPIDRSGLIALAQSVAAGTPFAFVRVDIFETDRGWVVSEVNDWTGNDDYPPYWDRRLGAAWAAALGQK